MSSEDKAPAAPITFPYVHTFERPITFGGKDGQGGETEYDIKLREPLLEDMIKHHLFDGMPDTAAIFDLVADLSGWAPPKVKKLPAREGMKLAGIVAGFFN